MATIVVPHRAAGKSRLKSAAFRYFGVSHAAIVRAMLEDVLAACLAVGPTILVTPSVVDAPPGVRVVLDAGRGQGEAVLAALRLVEDAPVLIVNSDLPCATPRDLELLLDAMPSGGLALVEAEDGTTNALALTSPELFEPLYGPGSAERFRRLAPSRVVHISNLEHDIDHDRDWPARERLGPKTREVLPFGSRRTA